MTNEVSAERTASLIEDARNYGPGNCSKGKFRKMCSKNSKTKRMDGNLKSKLHTAFGNQSNWPPLYIIEARVWDKKKQKEVVEKDFFIFFKKET